MAASDRILTIDIGAGCLRVAEFEYSGGAMFLTQFDWRDFDRYTEGADRASQIGGLVADILACNRFYGKKAYLCVSGQSAFVRFVKLPPLSGDEARIRQVVEYEAQQNVPFSMDEVVWDYQLIGRDNSDDMEVMFVVVKNEIIEQVTKAVIDGGLQPVLIEVSSTALSNTARASGLGRDECVMVLDIGEKCSDLLFLDGTNFFSRTIPIAGHTITQQIAKEFKIGLEEAEDLKKRHGFVALGAAYEEPESEVAAVVSKIIRNVMTRLHSEINRSKSVYCSQQKGRTPVKLYLTGGSSTMAYTDTFFNEKLKIETEYLKSFEIVQFTPDVDRNRLHEVAHTFGSVIGTALRHQIECPIEISLMPEKIQQVQEFNRKKKMMYGWMVVFVLIFATIFGKNMVMENSSATIKKNNAAILSSKKKISDRIDSSLTKGANSKRALEKKYEIYQQLIKDKAYPGDLISMIQQCVPSEHIKLSLVENYVPDDKNPTGENLPSKTHIRIRGFQLLPEDGRETPVDQFYAKLIASKLFKLAHDASGREIGLSANVVQPFGKDVRAFEIECELIEPIHVRRK